MTNQEILKTALRQSAVDMGCTPEDFLKEEPVVVLSRPHPGARRYLELPFDCGLTSYGNNVVASVSEACRALTEAYLRRFPAEHCFETPNLHVLNDALEGKGLRICFMAEYFLPDMIALKPLGCPYELRLLGPEDFQSLYLPQWSNALCEKRKELDMLGVGAYDGEELVGFAGASADCGTMWQIGIDVLSPYRRQNIAAALVSRLALEILDRDKVPFYCAAWCNVRSVRTAIRSGFRPAWVELTAKHIEFVEKQNGEK